jgi:hypothetical protein
MTLIVRARPASDLPAAKPCIATASIVSLHGNQHADQPAEDQRFPMPCGSSTDPRVSGSVGSQTPSTLQSCATGDRIGRSGTARLSCACDLPRRWSLRALLGGSVVGQVDDSPPVILEPDRALAQGEPLHRGGVAAGRRGRPRGHLGRPGRAGGQLPDRDAWLPDRSRR